MGIGGLNEILLFKFSQIGERILTGEKSNEIKTILPFAGGLKNLWKGFVPFSIYFIAFEQFLSTSSTEKLS